MFAIRFYLNYSLNFLLAYNNISSFYQNVRACAQMGPGHIGPPPKKDKEGNALCFCT